MKMKRKTVPTVIAAACKAGDKRTAMEVAIYGRKSAGPCLLFESITDMARSLRFLWKAARDREFQKECAACPDAVAGTLKLIEGELKIHIARKDWKWFQEFERELKRVCQDAHVVLFSKFGTRVHRMNNPNWFRQSLLANTGLVKTKVWDKKWQRFTDRKAEPLLRIAKEIHVPVRMLRREARKMGINPGKAGRPKS